jgi:hypothetical protein
VRGDAFWPIVACMGLSAAIAACGLGKDVAVEPNPSETSSSSAPAQPSSDETSSTGPGTSSGTADTSGTGSSSESGPLPDPDCACLPDVAQPTGDMLATPSCMPMLCAVEASCEAFRTSDCYPRESLMVDERALSCALTALRERTPGVVRWNLDVSLGFANRNGYVVILPDGRLITRSASREDRGQTLGDAIIGAPPTVASFDECLADPDLRSRFDCLVFDAGAPSVVCEDGE